MFYRGSVSYTLPSDKLLFGPRCTFFKKLMMAKFFFFPLISAYFSYTFRLEICEDWYPWARMAIIIRTGVEDAPFRRCPLVCCGTPVSRFFIYMQVPTTSCAVARADL